MKPFRLVVTLLSLGVIFSFSGCGGGGGKGETTQDKQFGLLSSKTWNLATVTLGGVDQNTAPLGTPWTNFKLTISGTKGSSSFNYSCAGRPALSPWPAGGGANGLGTWAFGADPVTQIIRDSGTADQLAMTYTVTATTLTVTFNFTGSGYTRINSVSGVWVFTFN